MLRKPFLRPPPPPRPHHVDYCTGYFRQQIQLRVMSEFLLNNAHPCGILSWRRIEIDSVFYKMIKTIIVSVPPLTCAPLASAPLVYSIRFWITYRPDQPYLLLENWVYYYSPFFLTFTFANSLVGDVRSQGPRKRTRGAYNPFGNVARFRQPISLFRVMVTFFSIVVLLYSLFDHCIRIFWLSLPFGSISRHEFHQERYQP